MKVAFMDIYYIFTALTFRWLVRYLEKCRSVRETTDPFVLDLYARNDLIMPFFFVFFSRNITRVGILRNS